MCKINPASDSRRGIIEREFLSLATIAMLAFLNAGGAKAQGTAGPVGGALPSDQAPAAAARSTAQVAGKPNLAGTWKLNADQSDNPMQKMREAQQESGGGDEGGGGYGRRGGMGGGGGMGGMGGGGDMGGGGGMQGGGGRRRGGMQPMAQLVIEQTPTSAKVSDSSGRVVAQYLAPSEQSPANSANNSGNGEGFPPAAAQWQDNKLVATQQTRNGGTTTRTYELSPDNKQLIVTTKIENQRFKTPITIRQVYDPVYASTGGE